jgi:Ring hydroxylating beta subunit
VPDPSLLTQLLDRQEITAVMAAYARWADLNQPEQQAAVFVADCRAQSAVIAWHRRHDGSEWTLYGRYVDRWTRTEEGWRLAERELRAAGAAGRDDRELRPLGRASGAPTRPALT